MVEKVLSFEQVKEIAEKFSDVIVRETASGRMLFTVYGGRLLGMWPKSDGHNPLWISADLEKTMQEGKWNVGGERLWIAPQRYFFFENPRDFEGFNVPAEIDPGEYVDKGDLVFESTFSLLDYHKSITLDESICTRAFKLISDPYSTSLPYAGVRITDTVSVPDTHMGICGWSLAQTKTCGPDSPATALFPAKNGSKVLSYFRTVTPQYADVLDGYARFKMDANDVYKIAIRPEDMVFDNPCKIVYVTPTQGNKSWLCLIKRSDDMPRSQADCVDVARSNPTGPMGAIQAYNDGPQVVPQGAAIPMFGEIELQLTKGKTEGDRVVSRATHELLAYEGTKEQVLELAKTALKISATPQIFS